MSFWKRLLGLEAAEKRRRYTESAMALNHAVRFHDLERVTALVNGDPALVFSREENQGETPLIAAVGQARHSPMYGPFRSRPGILIVELLLEHGADVNATRNDGCSPLHIAETEDLVELLLAKGADVNAISPNYGTPLHLTAGRGNLEIARLLLANGADVNARNTGGATALSCAYYTDLDTGFEHPCKEVADLLRQHGGR